MFQKLFQIEDGKMASIRYLSARKKWQVRWHVTTPRGVDKGSATFMDQIEALRFKAQKEDQARHLKMGRRVPVEHRVDQVAGRFLREEKRHWTERTQQHYGDVINRFIQWLPEQVQSIQQVRSGHVRAYLASMKHVKTGTLNRHLTPIKTFGKWAAKEYGLANFAAPVKTFKEPKPKPRVISQKELDTMMSKLEGEQRDIILFIANTGLRASEFCSLTADSVIGTPKGKMLEIYGKGHKKRAIPLNRTCLEILSSKDLKHHKGPIFHLSQSSYKQPRHRLYALCAKAGKFANIEAFGPHALRHYFATELFRRGASLKRVSVILGHSSVAVTERIYLHLIPDDFVGLTDLLDSPKP